MIALFDNFQTLSQFWSDFWSLATPFLIGVGTVMFVGFLLKGYARFLDSMKYILSNRYTFAFFVIMLIVFLYLYNQLKIDLGWG